MDNHDYTPGDQFDAQKWWIGVLGCSIFDYILLIAEWQHANDSISPTCGIIKTRKRKRHQKTDIMHSPSVNILCLRQKSDFMQTSSAGPSGSKKSTKDPNQALQEFVQQQNDPASDVSPCC